MGNVTKEQQRRMGPQACSQLMAFFLSQQSLPTPSLLSLPRTGISPFSSFRKPIHPLRNILNAASSQKPSQPFLLPHDTLAPLNACGSLFLFFFQHSSLYHGVTSSHLAPAVNCNHLGDLFPSYLVFDCRDSLRSLSTSQQ